MAHEAVEVLVCDECGQEVWGPASQVLGRARARGWQAREVVFLAVDDDGPQVRFTDRCPEHPAETIPRETVLDQAGGPGGIQPWMLP